MGLGGKGEMGLWGVVSWGGFVGEVEVEEGSGKSGKGGGV